MKPFVAIGGVLDNLFFLPRPCISGASSAAVEELATKAIFTVTASFSEQILP